MLLVLLSIVGILLVLFAVAFLFDLKARRRGQRLTVTGLRGSGYYSVGGNTAVGGDGFDGDGGFDGGGGDGGGGGGE